MCVCLCVAVDYSDALYKDTGLKVVDAGIGKGVSQNDALSVIFGCEKAS